MGRRETDCKPNTLIVSLGSLTLFITPRESGMGTQEHQYHGLGEDHILSNDLAPTYQ